MDPDDSSSPSSTRTPKTWWGVPRVWLNPTSLTILAILALVALMIWRNQTGHTSTSSTTGPKPNREGVFTCAPGPWGELEYERITIAPPQQYVPQAFQTGDEVSWSFLGYNRAQVEQVFRDLGLPPDEFDGLLRATWEEIPAGTLVRPSLPIVERLPREPRGRLYRLLANLDETSNQARAFRFPANQQDEWFVRSQLRPATIELVRRYCYPSGTGLAFCDLECVFRKLPDDEERQELWRVLMRQSALLVRLRVREGANVQALADYWSLKGQRKDLEPLLGSLSRRRGGGRVDIVHLLPPFPRGRLNSYPLAGRAELYSLWDCYYSALNFMREQPTDDFAVFETAVNELQTNYRLVSDAAQLGDILILRKSDGVTLHACVYIADNIVFTKNGNPSTAPWILSTIEDVISIYDTDPPIQVLRYRHNSL